LVADITLFIADAALKKPAEAAETRRGGAATKKHLKTQSPQRTQRGLGPQPKGVKNAEAQRAQRKRAEVLVAADSGVDENKHSIRRNPSQHLQWIYSKARAADHGFFGGI
jgi:hypothetical protein